MSVNEAFRELELRMEELSGQDGNIFLPNVRPCERVDYVFISMEPSLGRWASSPEKARLKVAEGFRNFMSSMEDFIVHFCVREYLCGKTQNYFITDISKGAMLAKDAGTARMERYNRWYELLLKELDIVAKPESKVFVFGNTVASFLESVSFPRPFQKLIHFSPLASKARNDGIQGKEDSFNVFKELVKLEDILLSARETFAKSNIPVTLQAETMNRLARKRLTESQKKLIFNYKMQFELSTQP
jgi:hypothetical protein